MNFVRSRTLTCVKEPNDESLNILNVMKADFSFWRGKHSFQVRASKKGHFREENTFSVRLRVTNIHLIHRFEHQKFLVFVKFFEMETEELVQKLPCFHQVPCKILTPSIRNLRLARKFIKQTEARYPQAKDKANGKKSWGYQTNCFCLSLMMVFYWSHCGKTEDILLHTITRFHGFRFNQVNEPKIL